MPVSKDEKRIYDIQTKGHDLDHMRRLAATQANRITDVPKCRRRYNAALDILGRLHPVSIVFRNRYNELTGNAEPVVRETREVVITGFNDTEQVSVDIDLTNKQRTKEDKKKNLEALKEKISTGKKENSVDDYIAFFRK